MGRKNHKNNNVQRTKIRTHGSTAPGYSSETWVTSLDANNEKRLANLRSTLSVTELRRWEEARSANPNWQNEYCQNLKWVIAHEEHPQKPAKRAAQAIQRILNTI